jgi:hypothetical protein
MDKFKKTITIDKTFMKTILQGWNFIRILRLVLALAILTQGIIARDSMAIILGIVFGGMAVANIGCCGAGGCAVNQRMAGKRIE